MGVCLDFEDLCGDELQLLSEGLLFSELLEELVLYRLLCLDLFLAALRFLTGVDSGLELALEFETGVFFLLFFFCLLDVGVSAGAFV